MLTAASLPVNTEFVAAIFETPRTDASFFVPGQSAVCIRRILPGPPATFRAEAAFDLGEPVAQLAAVNDPAGTRLLARFSNGVLALFGYTQAGGFSAPQPPTPTGVTGVFSGLVHRDRRRQHRHGSP